MAGASLDRRAPSDMVSLERWSTTMHRSNRFSVRQGSLPGTPGKLSEKRWVCTRHGAASNFQSAEGPKTEKAAFGRLFNCTSTFSSYIMKDMLSHWQK